MAKYKAYTEYRDSGVEWCNKLPLSWKRANLRWLSNIYAGGTPSKNIIDYWENGTIPWINSGAVNQGYVIKPSTYISKAAYHNSSAKWIQRGALVVALAGQGKTKGMTAQLGINTTCNQSMAAIVLHRNKLSRYMYWWLTSNYQNIRNMAGGDLRDGLNLELLEDIQCPQPGEEECSKISIFLDHETVKIDTLIKKQQQLIELLKEKRQAVISHAVTKGLNPDVPMKDSGVDWLGGVPDHWDVCAIKYIVSTPITDGPHETPDFIDDGVPFISAEAISSGVIDFNKKRACISTRDHKKFSNKYSPKFNDIYMVKSGATTGIAAIVETHDDFNIWSPLAVIRCNDYSNPYFVINFMRSRPFQTAIELNWSYGTQQNIGMSVIGNLHIARPPVSEAIDIATYLRAKCLKFDELIDIAMMQISIMQERRTALISAAVTGKIDVRDWVAPETQNETFAEEATA